MIAASTRIQSGTLGATEPPKSGASQATRILTRFHALMLQQAFKTMMQTDTVNNGKSTLARDVWRDQLAEKLAAAATQSAVSTEPESPERSVGGWRPKVSRAASGS